MNKIDTLERKGDILDEAGGKAALRRKAKPTLTPFGLNHNQTIDFMLSDGRMWQMTLVSTSAEVIARDYAAYGYHDPGHASGDISAYTFTAEVLVNGEIHRLHREVGTQSSFYEPWELDGVRIWFDAVSCIFKDDGGFIDEKDWRSGLICMPQQNARFAIQEATLPICPEPLYPWYANESRQLDIDKCYNGEDCWMGPYGGGATHCGLDINMPAGTVLSAPLTFDDHYLVRSTEAGFKNNYWRGIRRWPDGSEWWLESAHMSSIIVPERTLLKRGTEYAIGAGVFVGSHEHTHFNFRVIDQGGEYLLDPWILFWEIFRQQRDRRG